MALFAFQDADPKKGTFLILRPTSSAEVQVSNLKCDLNENNLAESDTKPHFILAQNKSNTSRF